MTTFGVTVVKDEADIIGTTVAHMLGQVDAVLVIDNGSTDGTRDILDALPVTVVDDDEPAFYQGRKMTRLAAIAAEQGAEWVVPFDADEWWYSPFGRISDVLAKLDRHSVAPAKLFDHVPTALDPDEPDPVRRIGWRRRNVSPLPKVAARTHPDLTIADGNHSANFGRFAGRRINGQLIVRHYPYRTAEQMIAKALKGAAGLGLTDLPESTGQHWRDYARLVQTHGDQTLADVFTGHFYSDNPHADPSLIFDPAP